MIKPLEVWWSNFLSYGNNVTRVNLDFTKPTLIIGRNLDATIEGQVDSNGSGKSVMINAIAYAAYDRTIGGKIKVDKLINNINKKNMLVGFSFEKTTGSGIMYYFVERWRKNKVRGPDGILIKENTVNDYDTAKDITPDSIAKANKKLEEIIGHSFDVFSRICLYSSSQDSFFALPITSTNGTNRSDIIEELFSLTDLSKDADILKDDIKQTKASLNTMIEVNAQITQELNRHSEQLKNIDQEYDEWNVNHKRKLETSQFRLTELSKIEFEDEVAIFDSIKELNVKLTDLANENNIIIREIRQHNGTLLKIDEFNNDKIKKVQALKNRLDELKEVPFEKEMAQLTLALEKDAEISSLTNKLNLSLASTKIVTNDVNKLVDEIEHLADSTCPYCSQHYEEAKVKLVEKKATLEELNTKLAELTKHNDSLKKDIDALKEESNTLRDGLRFDSLAKYNTLKNEFDSLVDKIKTTEETVNPYSVENIDTKALEARSEKIVKEEATLTKKVERCKSLLAYPTERELNIIEAEFKALKSNFESLKEEVNPHGKTRDKLQQMKLPENRNDEIQELTTHIKHQDFLYKLLTSKDSFIRKALLTKNLAYLNTRFQYYLAKIGLPHKVVLNFDMSATISEFNNEIDYENLSTGQKARINIALSFAFRDVLQKRHGKITFTVLDECLDSGLGNVGVQMTVKMIKEVAKEEKLAMFVISHRDETTTMFDSKLEIEKDNKFSTIVRSDV